MIRRWLLSFAIATSVAVPVAAQDWHFVGTPYFMVPTMDGRAAIGPVDARVSTSPSDVFSNLNWGIMGLFEVNNGQSGVNLDVSYMNLDVTDDRTRASINGHQGAYAATVLYRVHPYAELYAGGRLNNIGATLDTNGPGGARSASRSKSWIDPIIGVRAVLPFNEKVDLSVLADIGGFGVGSDHAAQLWPSLGIRLGARTKLMAGYRLIYTDYQDGEGASRFVYDVLTYGPTIGFQTTF